MAGFVGTANLLPDGDGLVTVRPERIRFGAPAGDETGATGTVDAVQLPRRHHPLPGASSTTASVLVVEVANTTTAPPVAVGDTVQLAWRAYRSTASGSTAR